MEARYSNIDNQRGRNRDRGRRPGLREGEFTVEKTSSSTGNKEGNIQNKSGKNRTRFLSLFDLILDAILFVGLAVYTAYLLFLIPGSNDAMTIPLLIGLVIMTATMFALLHHQIRKYKLKVASK